MNKLVIFFSLALVTMTSSQGVTWYDHYTAGGRQSGLDPASSEGFLLNGKPFRLVSGAIHYFRVHPAYWRDRLKKLRAIGANTVETYLPWNLHNPQPSVFDFGDGQNDMSPFLNVTAFIQIAREEDLFVILRPGPYICAEWDFGGMPSWLLRDPNMAVRTPYKGFLDPADAFLAEVFKRVSSFQFTKGDGPIIAFQVENEYGQKNHQYGYFGSDTAYLIHLRDKMVESGAVEMFFTSDSPAGVGDRGSIPGVLQTANFNNGPDSQFDALDNLQPGKPHMATEYWSGWFDHWGQGFHDTGLSVTSFSDNLERIFIRNGSVNFYMFHGGTNFGFMNGANSEGNSPYYSPTISSYDYDSPLSEAGDYTAKYDAAKALIAKYNYNVPNVAMPAQPVQTTKTAYPSLTTTQHLTLNQLLEQVPSNLVIQSSTLTSMEDLPINGNSGQSYGFIHYRKILQLSNGNHQVQTKGRVRDLAVFLLNSRCLTPSWANNNVLTGFGYYGSADQTLSFTANSGNGDYTVDFLVENMGRVNFGGDVYKKHGLSEGPVLIDNVEITDWNHYPLEFTSAWVKSLTNWTNSVPTNKNTPTLTRFVLNLANDPTDTFIKTGSSGPGNRGIVFVNGFNIGRFSDIGPTLSLFVPAPFLNRGDNTIDVFSLFSPVETIDFLATPSLG